MKLFLKAKAISASSKIEQIYQFFKNDPRFRTSDFRSRSDCFDDGPDIYEETYPLNKRNMVFELYMYFSPEKEIGLNCPYAPQGVLKSQLFDLIRNLIQEINSSNDLSKLPELAEAMIGYTSLPLETR